MDEHLKNTFDVLAFSGAIAVLLGILPAISALLSVIWLAMRIFEGVPKMIDTFRYLRETMRQKK